MLTARPADYALDDLNAPGVLRRGSTQFVVKQKYADEVTKEQEDACMAAFKEIASSLDKEGAALDSALREHLDLDAYYEWLAFNYLVRNGDYTDEVFYYLQPDTEPVRFGIIPWDFDDILSQEPHETSELRDRRFLDDQLIFSSEDPLDRKIARDSVLYHDYLTKAKSVLEILNEAFIKNTFDRISQELEVMVEDPDILKSSSLDLYPITKVEDLNKEIRVTSNYLQSRVSLMYEKVRYQLNQP
jgi:spore coat protein H